MEYINRACDSDSAMILVCPSCDTRYFAEDAAVGKEGRRVRCASCGHSWFAKPHEDNAAAEAESTGGLTREQVERLRLTAVANSAAPAGPHAEYRAREHARRERHRTLAAGLAWLGGFVIFAGTAAGAVVFRNEVTEAWPRTASVYRMVGLDVNRFGLTFENVGAKRSFDGTTPVLTVTGMAVNTGKTRRAAPGVRVSLRDEAGKEVHAWTDKLATPFIEAGERTPFSSRIVAPPLETFGLAITFAATAGATNEGDEASVAHDEIGHADMAPGEAADTPHSQAEMEASPEDPMPDSLEADGEPKVEADGAVPAPGETPHH